MSYVGVTQSESGENGFYPSTFVIRWGPILNILFDLSQLSSLPSQGVPLPMPPIGDGLPKWSPHISRGDCFMRCCRGPPCCIAFSFPRTLTCPGTQQRSMIISSSSALRISSLVSTTIGEKEESDLSARKALLVRKNCEPIAICGSLQDFMYGSIYCIQFCCEYWSLSSKSATTGGVRKHCCKAHTFGGLRAICTNMHRRMPLQVC